MSLTGRFSSLFLGTLAVVLVAFSAALYVSARVYLDRGVRERLDAALAVLAAAAEIHSDGVEWEPQERVLPLGQEPGPERLRWIVYDNRGRVIDHSRNLVETDLTHDRVPGAAPAKRPARVVDRQGRSWQVAWRELRPDAVMRTGSHAAAGKEQPDDAHPSEVFYPLLVLGAYAPLGAKEATLATLGWLLTVLSTATFLVAALLCRRLSRQALAPLAHMVASARDLNAADAGWSLELAGTGDELDDLGQAFNKLLSRLNVAYQQQKRFSSDASHQLRTPLTILIGQIEVALRHERSGEEYRRALGSALRKADQLRQIVEGLLFLGRTDADAQLPDGELIDLETWLAAYVTSRFATAGPVDVIHRPMNGARLSVRVHAPLLDQLLDNLLDNARKYASAGTPIVVETARDGEQAMLIVTDSGPGIPCEELPKVFEPFYRAESSRRHGVPGVGLGLAIVQRIATAFGGTVLVQSEPGVGSRFEVRLPTVPADIGSATERTTTTALQHAVSS